MVLSELVKRLMMIVRAGRLNVRSGVQVRYGLCLQPIERGRHNLRPSGHRRPGEPGQELLKNHAAGALPHSNEVPSTQMQWRITAILRAIATFAFFIPMRLASSIPQALSDGHFLVR
jgi:hypothetical protein